MKSSYILLIIGGVLLTAGLIIAGFSTFSVTKEVLEGAVLINETSIDANRSYVAVIKDLPAGQQFLFSLSGNPSDVPLRAQFTEADGNTLAIYNITKTPFTSTVAIKTAGDHTLEIKNVGTRTVTVNGALLNSPLGQQGGGVSIQDDPSVQTLVTYGIGILVGIVLIIAGIVLLIIGAIKHVKGSKRGESVPR